MNRIQAIGFDLFNTLVTVEPQTLADAMKRLLERLHRSGLSVEAGSFVTAYREAALRFLEATRLDGRETHNRFWISAALESQGYEVGPNDARIDRGIEAYFSAFSQQCHLLPGTLEMLGILRGRYRLGLLSNFTHGPAAWQIIQEAGLTPHFQVVLFSGDLGYRKPHPSVFERLVKCLGVPKDRILYVGDDVGPDIVGASSAGIQPVWITYAQDRNQRYVSDLLYKDVPEPDASVPRISSWDDLLRLLDKKGEDAPLADRIGLC